MKLVTTSWDDGHVLDFKLADLLHKYNLAATFYIPQSNAEHEVMQPQQVIELAKQFEIGGHTINHVRLHTQDEQVLIREINGSFQWLDDLLGYKPVSFCFPGGVFHNKAISVVHSAGYKVARTTELLSTQPFICKGLTPTTLQVYRHSGFTYFKHLVKRRRIANLLRWLSSNNSYNLQRLAGNYIDIINSNNGCFHLWGHSWEIEEFGLWNKLEQLFKVISHRKEFTYVPNKDLIAYVTP